ncbi:MAG: YHS domain-containing protein [Chloroflexi bacterium RBG_16_50_9]|nr:MAG: YHS domain-containing protein [Chloroflexi bacterium RBG_16_50_9]
MAGGSKVIDPVCGMQVDPKTAPARSDYMGKTYYFCSPACKKSFDANPTKYTGGGEHEMAKHGGGTHHM